MLKKIAAAASQAVLGNPIERDYDLKAQVGSAGPGYLWRIHPCTHKASGQTYSAFVFDKKHVERFAKHEQAQIMDVLKKGAASLARLRHPRVLEIHQVELSRAHSKRTPFPKGAACSTICSR
jgi:SCY1-like protein 2